VSLKDDQQQNIQMELDFSSEPTGEAREAGREETESSGATNGTENPASTNRWMEEVCERENLKAALRQVKANKGSPGVDGMTVGGITDHLKQHWAAIREQLLIRALEQRSATSEAEQLPRLPEWLLKGWEAQGVPIHDGRPDYAAMEQMGAEQRADADSISAGTEERQSPHVPVPSNAIRALYILKVRLYTLSGVFCSQTYKIGL
jgi:hypothetical protein